MEQTALSGPSAIRNLSLVAMQGLNHTIYGEVNQRFYDPMRMTARIARFGGRLHKAVRVGDAHATEYHLVMAFSWSLGLANKLGFIVQDKLWERFPGVCSHCGGCPCCCKDPVTRDAKIQMQRFQPATTLQFQRMLMEIYPNNTPDSQAGHLVEEICEVLEAVDNFTGTSQEEFRADTIIELIDVFAHLFGVASCMNVGIAVAMEKHFGSGCYQCHQTSCHCPFPATRTISPRKRE